MVKEIFIFSCVIFSCALVAKGSITYQSDVYITNDPNTVQEEGNLYVSGDASVSSLNISDMIYMSQSPRPKFLADADNSFGSLSRGMIFGGGNSVNTVNEYAFAFGAGNTVNAQNSIASIWTWKFRKLRTVVFVWGVLQHERKRFFCLWKKFRNSRLLRCGYG